VLPESDGIRVGVIWASSSWNATRSVPLADFAPLAEVPNARSFSLQQGPDAAEAAHAPFPLIDLSPQTADVAQAAAAMLQLDLIITIDSMPAHLAGALGRPVWLLLQHDADWRWQRTGETSPWYPSMRIFRQPEPDNWGAAVLSAQAALVDVQSRFGGVS
jgi:ADP-heptose:LPS heptosyltransferase